MDIHHERFHLLTAILVASTIIMMSCSSIEPPIIEEFPIDYNKYLVAHRGAWCKNGHNENSYKSVLAAAELGVWGAEIDIYETSDGNFILNHDTSLFGLDISSTSLDDFRGYNFTNGDSVTTLDQIMEILKIYPDFHLQIEVKAGDAKKISKVITDSNTEQQVVIISFKKDICYDFLEKTTLPVMLLANKKEEFDAKKLKEDGFWGVSMYYYACLQCESIINDCHEYGLKLCVWSLNNINEIAWFMSRGVDFITTDSIEDITYDALINCFRK